MAKTYEEIIAKINTRRADLAHRIKQLRELGGEGSAYMADVLEESKLRLDQMVYEMNLARSN